MIHGIDVGKDVGSPVEREDAEGEIADPLRDFPNDVDYSTFKDEEIGRRGQEYAKFKKRCERPLNDEEAAYFWTPERVDAFKGDDALARRCSVNGQLWVLYSHIKTLKGAVGEYEIRRIITDDIQFSAFFPTSQDLAKYRQLDDDGNVISEVRTDEMQIEQGLTPDAHIEHLIKSGKMSDLLKRLSCNGTVAFPKELL